MGRWFTQVRNAHRLHHAPANPLHPDPCQPGEESGRIAKANSGMVGTHWRVLAVLLAVLILAVGCGSSGEISVNASASGGQAELERGQVLVVTLESNPSTGFRWEVAEPDDTESCQCSNPKSNTSTYVICLHPAWADRTLQRQ